VSRLVTKNLRYFNSLLFGKATLIQVDTVLAVSDVALHPALEDVYNSILHSVREFLEK
jgi:hypothetical protein